jgi:Tol biopolymer transport system component
MTLRTFTLYLAIMLLVGCGDDDDATLSLAQSDVSNGAIAFVSEMDGDAEIYTIDADGNNLQQLTFNDEFDDFPRWTPDGTQIAYIHGPNDNLYIMNSDGTNNKSLNIDISMRSFSWSPDGNQIVFQGVNDIYVFNMLNDTLTNITDSDAVDFDPTWSPDGNRIAFASSGDNDIPLAVHGDPRLNIHIVNSDGSNETVLSLGGNGVLGLGSLDWFEQDTIIYSAYRQQSIFSINVNTGEITPILDDISDFASMPDISPDNRYIAYVTTTELSVMNIDGSNIQVVADFPRNFRHPDWQPVLGTGQAPVTTPSPTP